MSLPSQGAVLAYWIPVVGIGSPTQDVSVPLTDVLNYQTNVVFLGFAAFTSDSAPYITIPDTLVQQMTLQPGQSQTNVQQLQAAGIQVLLSVQGSNGYGWDGISSSENANFAQWVQTNIIEQYGLDGIDIDNEWSNLPSNPQSFMNTVGTLRSVLTSSLISKALWDDTDYFTTAVAAGTPNAGKYLGQILDFGATMAYGYGYYTQISFMQSYHDIVVDGVNVGLGWNQLAIGVQAGPANTDWMTPTDETYKLAVWSVAPDSPQILGMMVYTFSQDIQQFTYNPQNDPSKLFPNADDHQWQRTIIAGFNGRPQPPD